VITKLVKASELTQALKRDILFQTADFIAEHQEIGIRSVRIRMNFFEHLDSEFAYSKEAFLYTINKLPDAKIIVINIGISSLSHNTGLLNIRSFKNFIKDVVEFVNTNFKRRVVIVVSDSLEELKHQYLQPSRPSTNEFRTHNQVKLTQNIPSANSGLYYALISLIHNDVVNLFCHDFSQYNLRGIGFSVSSMATDATGELNKTLKTIESIVFSNTKDNDTKVNAVRDLLNTKKIIVQPANFKAKKTAEAVKELFRNFPKTIPIIMEDVSQKDNYSEEDDGFAAKIAIAIDADVVLSISRKGMLYTVDPDKSTNAKRFYCFDTGRSKPFSESRRLELSKKLNAARHVNAHDKSIPMILMPYDNPYAICNIFNKDVIDGICSNGEYPKFTIFINSLHVSLPIEKRHVSGKIIIDDNAEKSLRDGNNSLLAVGIVKVEGDFESKSVVSILNQQCIEVGRGVVDRNSQEIKNAMCQEISKPIIDRKKMRIKDDNRN